MKDPAEASRRLYYLDWIRVLSMAGIFFFHNARFYDAFSDWHVKNASTNMAASYTIAFMSQWIMPLFFLIAGAGTYYALKSRSPGHYIRERTSRLLVPFVFGMLVIVVPQAYFQAVSHGEQLGQYNLFQIYWLYLQNLPNLETFHLWFLADLFIFSIVAVPLIFPMGKSGKSIITRLASFLDKPWVLLPLLFISITAVNVLVYPDGYWGYRNGGWNIVAYLLFFIFGYLIFANSHIIEIARKLRWITLCAGIGALLCIIIFFMDELADPVKYFGNITFVFASLLQALNTWGWLLAILGLGSHFLNRNNRFLAYANEAVLPFYILHQTVIIIIGYYIVQWNTGIGLKYFAISTTSFLSIMLIYETLVRRTNALRFLFGMRLLRRPQRKS